VLASTLGTAGTLWGAAVGSVVSTVAAALYAHSLNKGKQKITRVIPIKPGQPMRVRERTQVMTALPPVNGPKPLPEHLNPRKRRRFDIKLDRRFWIKVALAAVGMFILVMGIITGIELIGQKPVSSIVGNTETSRSTTIGSVTNRSSSSEIEEEQEQQNEESPASPTESTPATGTSSPTTEPEEEESEATTSARPTTSPTATPTAPTEVEEESTPEEDVSTTAVPQTTPTPPSPEE
jgi:cytoskeletal protein RodZ